MSPLSLWEAFVKKVKESYPFDKKANGAICAFCLFNLIK